MNDNTDKNNFSILTKKDVLILQKLLEDGRKSSSCISKEIDLGREIVNYRIKRLIKENLIIKFIPKINDKVLNYKEYIILLKLNLEDDISKEKFIKEHIGNKYLVWVIKSKSGWDLVVRLYAKSVEEFKEKMSEVLENYSEVLAKYYTIISTDEIKSDEKELLSKNLFEKTKKNDFKVIKEEEKQILDEKNSEILHLLEEDGRIQYKEIGEKLNISSDTVKYRIEKMKSQGILENIVPVLNYNKLGYLQYACILKFLFLNSIQESQVSEFINSNKHILKAIKSLNTSEYFLTLAFENQKDIIEFEKGCKILFEEKLDSIEIFKID